MLFMALMFGCQPIGCEFKGNATVFILYTLLYFVLIILNLQNPGLGQVSLGVVLVQLSPFCLTYL